MSALKLQIHYRILLFLGSLLVFVIFGGLLHGRVYDVIFTFAYTATMIMGPYIVFKRGKYLNLSICIAAIALSLSYIADFSQNRSVQIISGVFWTMFNAYTTILMLAYTRRIQKVEVDHILVVIIGYILIGMSYAALFSTLQYINPASFEIPEAMMYSEREAWQHLLYYSYMTLTTVGYGDITPHTHLARMAASTEAILGVMFIGIFVALMVAMQTAHFEKLEEEVEAHQHEKDTDTKH